MLRFPRARATDDAADSTLSPIIGALRAVEDDLRHERLDRAWVDLDIAAARLAQHGSQPGAASPALDRAFGAIERARDMLGRAHTSQATASITAALMALMA